jgi:hypothetical protein
MGMFINEIKVDNGKVQTRIEVGRNLLPGQVRSRASSSTALRIIGSTTMVEEAEEEVVQEVVERAAAEIRSSFQV